jgi:hypothetical protein
MKLRFQVLTVVTLKNTLFWVAIPFSQVYSYMRYVEICHLHLQEGIRILSTQKT